MKKKLLIAKFALLTTILNAQILTYVGDQASVTILDETLVYSGGGFRTAGTGKVDNYGNVMIEATGSDEVILEETSSFNLKLSSISDYGQLYISGIPQNKIIGKVNKEYRADANSGITAMQQMALPFYNYSIADLVSDLTNSPANSTGANYLNVTVTTNNSAGRFSPNSVFRWNNGRARFDQIAAAEAQWGSVNVGSPLDYYIIPRRNASGTVVWDAASATLVTTFKGTPVSDVSGHQQFVLSGAANGINFGVNGGAANYFGERYYSYLDDPFRSKTGNAGGWDVDYAKNLYQLANPFLINVDLKYIGQNEAVNSDGNAIPNLEGIAYYSSGLSWTREEGTSYPTGAGQVIKATASGGVFQSGDVDRLVIKPMGEFMIKLSSDNGADPLSKIDFTQLRRFALTSRNNATDTTNPTSRLVDDSLPADKVVKQLAVIMYDTDSIEIGRTYYAVSPSAITGNNASARLQAYDADGSFIFTKEELAAGGEDYAKQDKLYINEANEVDFLTKKIPLYIRYNSTPYYLKFEVYERGERVRNEGLSCGRHFYIETSDNNYVRINDGDYMSLSGYQDLGLYFEKPSSTTLGTDNVSANETIIAKKNSDWVVRFSKQWKRAKVEVFSAAGQLVHTRDNIDTYSDYVIPVSKQIKATYIVKAISDKGEVVVKKIIN